MRKPKLKILFAAIASAVFCSGLFLAEKQATAEETPVMETRGAQIFLERNTSDGGIAFPMFLKNEQFEKLSENGIVQTGTLLIPTDLLTGELTVSTPLVENTVTYDGTTEFNAWFDGIRYGVDGYHCSLVYLKNIPKSDFAREITARGYMRLTNGNYVYFEPVSHSVQEVARNVLNGTYVWTDEQTCILTDYAYGAEQYTVSFYSADPKFETVEKIVSYGETVEKIPVPEAPVSGEFSGWYEDGASEPFDFTTPIKKDTVLKAGFSFGEKETVYGVTHYKKGRTLLSVSEMLSALKAGKKYLSFNLYVDEDCTFDGLYMQISGRHVKITSRQMSVASLKNGAQTDTNYIPDDFFAVYGTDGEKVVDYVVAGNTATWGTAGGKLQKGTVYKVFINLDGRYFRGTEYEFDEEYLTRNAQDVSITSLSTTKAYITDVAVSQERIVKKATFEKPYETLTVGEQKDVKFFTLNGWAHPTFTSSDSSVVSFENGKMTAKKEGVAILKAQTDGTQAEMKVVVISPEYVPETVSETAEKLVVAKDGSGHFSSLNDAFDYVEQGSDVFVLLKEGVYDEVVNVNEKYKNVTLLGTDKEKCIIQNTTGVYKNSPFLISGNFRLENLCFKMTLDNVGTFVPTYDGSNSDTVFETFPGYALHIDWQSLNPDEPAYGLIKDCKLYSEAFPCVGMGLSKNQTVEFDGCEMVRNVIDDRYYILNGGTVTNAWLGAFLCHCAGDTGSPNQLLILRNNSLSTNKGKAGLLRSDLPGGSDMTVLAQNNTFCSATDGADSLEWWEQKNLHEDSFGNTATNLNNRSLLGPYLVKFVDSKTGQTVALTSVEKGEKVSPPDVPVSLPLSTHNVWYQGGAPYDFSKSVGKDLTIESHPVLNEMSVQMNSYRYGTPERILSVREMYDTLENGKEYLSFQLEAESISSTQGVYFKISGRHLFLTEEGTLIYSLDWQDDRNYIPNDFVCIYDDTGELINDYAYYSSFFVGSKRGKLVKGKTYTVVINLTGRFFQGTGSDTYEYLNANNEDISLSSYNNAIVYVKDFSLLSGAELKGICLDKTSVEISVNGTVQLIATTSDETSVVAWSSADPAVATVTQNGLVKGIKKGETVVSAKLPNGKTANCRVTVGEETVHYVVAKDGSGDFDTLNGALSSVPKGGKVAIYLKEGVYEEVCYYPSYFEYVEVVGESRDKCIILDETGVYKNSPFVVNGNFRLENLTFKQTLNKRGNWNPYFGPGFDVLENFPGYSLHIDADSYNREKPAYGLVKNCYLYSEAFPAVGMGTNKNQTVEFDGCELIRNVIDTQFYYLSGWAGDNCWEGAILCHAANDLDSRDAINQKLILRNCYFYSNLGASAHIRDDTTANKKNFTVLLQNNVFLSETVGKNSLLYWYNGSILDPDSYGNVGGTTMACGGHGTSYLSINLKNTQDKDSVQTDGKGETMEKHETFYMDGKYLVSVDIPSNFNGDWIWKMEYFHAFEAAELDLYKDGYARVHINIAEPDGTPCMYASESHLDILYRMHEKVVADYGLNYKAILFGFSRGGLNAFNFSLKYPALVKLVYMDAPVLDLRVWPRITQANELIMHNNMLEEYKMTEEEFSTAPVQPVDHFDEYFALKIPTLLIAGTSDSIVRFDDCTQKLLDYYEANRAKIDASMPFVYYIKVGADHHPHGFGHASLGYESSFDVYSNQFAGTDENKTVNVSNADTELVCSFVRQHT